MVCNAEMVNVNSFGEFIELDSVCLHILQNVVHLHKNQLKQYFWQTNIIAACENY